MKNMYAIFLNGKYPKDLAKIKKYILDRIVICADGGANYAYALNILPEAIIGDMDSVDKEILKYYENKGVKILKTLKEKDYTDFELCLKYIENEDFTDLTTRFLKNIDKDSLKKTKDIIVFGATGNRVDMTLSNLKKLHTNENMLIISEEFEKIRYKEFYEDFLKIEGLKDKLFSIIPITNLTNLTLEGFKYSVNKINVKKDIGLASNIVVSDEAYIYLEKGEMYIINE